MRSANALNLHSWLSISKSETLVIFVVLTPLINAALGMVQGAGHVLRWLVVAREGVEVKNVYLWNEMDQHLVGSQNRGNVRVFNFITLQEEPSFELVVPAHSRSTHTHTTVHLQS